MGRLKTLLINPLLQSPFPAIPLGLGYIASFLESNGKKVEFVDFAALGEHDKKLIENEILEKKPDIVGITATEPQVSFAYDIAKTIKNLLPETFVVLGGSHFTFIWKETLSKHPEIDVIVLHEGEYTMLELVETLERGEDLANVKGIAYRDSSQKIVKTSLRPLIEDLDSIPFPAWHLMPLQLYRYEYGCMYVLTSRGCPSNCCFCVSPAMWMRKFRVRSVKNVVDEIEVLMKKHRFDYIYFVDDVFTLDMERTIKICDEILNRKLSFEWGCMTRVDCVNRELLRKMYHAGCRSILFGIESGSQNILNHMGKKTTSFQARDAVKWAKEFGITVTGSFIIGHPGETREDMIKTFEFSQTLGLDFIQYHPLIVYPGTPLFNKVGKLGIAVNEETLKLIVLNVIKVAGLKGVTLERLKKWALSSGLTSETLEKVLENLTKSGSVISENEKFYSSEHKK